jgi:hypothetical protein
MQLLLKFKFWIIVAILGIILASGTWTVAHWSQPSFYASACHAWDEHLPFPFFNEE